jgi:hypothetical protein
VREAIRTRHYSRRTEETYVQWITRFILFHGKRHPFNQDLCALRRRGLSFRRLHRNAAGRLNP